MSSSPLLSLPYELRRRILGLALKQDGRLELQHPVWTGLQDYWKPLFYVCRSLRDEALEAFYEANDFIWIVDIEHDVRSDPSLYPQPATITDRGKQFTSQAQPPLTPVLPWDYPELMRRLRNLQVNLYLPQTRDVSILRQRLEKLVEVLDHGCRLTEFHILVTCKHRGTQITVTPEARDALEVLVGMAVRGRVKVQTRYHIRTLAASVDELNLERRMRAN